ncbi:MAG: ORF6N domain-containing protein [Candidatus Omnitrophica bacterium]|nr:ORF6N domain-containing protein [Candidatus Omnitrophota bacterium]
MRALVPQEIIEKKILMIRGHKVMLDSDLAELYGVETKYLTRQVRRNIVRFPEGFMLLLTRQEVRYLRCHFGTSKGRGGRRYRPYAFTEQGVAMLSAVLNSEKAIQVSIAIMKVFVRLREILSNHKELAYKLEELERRIEKHDEDIQSIFEAIRQLMVPPVKPKRHIGFHAD